MVNERYANAMAEVLYYLKGIREEDQNKISKDLLKLFEENASKDYECNFDYTKPLKEIEVLDETRGLISLICLNYWCDTEEKKQKYIDKLNENEKNYQEELKKKYNVDDMFKTNNETTSATNVEENTKNEETLPTVVKESFFSKIVDKLKKFFRK